MLGNQGTNQQGFDSREALRDTGPEMGGAVEVAHQRLATIDSGVYILDSMLGVTSSHQEAAVAREVTPSYSPVAEAEAITRQAAEQQAAMGDSAREQLQGMPDSSPRVPDASAYTVPPVPESPVMSQISYISQLADERYKSNLSGMN